MIAKACIEDVEGMKALIDFHASRERMLPRSLSYLYETYATTSCTVKVNCLSAAAPSTSAGGI
jgi:N-acetylglutamate synthase-like GNAT family acetyltransferase